MFGKKKIEQAQFEGELEGLLRLFPAWEVENKPQPPPALVARFNEFRRIVPDRKSSQLLSRLLCETIDNQIKAMSHLAIAMSKNPDDLLASAKEFRIGQTYLARMNCAAEVLVRHVATLDESDPMRKFFIDYGFYDPSGGKQPPSVEPPSAVERSHALDFLRALQWATSRQQLAVEEWNDAGAMEVSGPLGDEIREVPTFNLNAANAPRLMPVAERRLASAQLVRDEFAKLKSGQLPDSVSTAVDAWARAFDMHLRRCEITVRNLQTLIAGTPDGGENDADLVPDESLLGDQAVAAEGAVMQRYGIDFAELQDMMVTACNILRSELGKPPLSFEEYGEIFKMGETGQRPRFYA
jgi:hypothetical protein